MWYITNKKRRPFYILSKAKIVVRNLGITTPKAYKKNRHQDEQLPPDPPYYYSDKHEPWVSWEDFFSDPLPYTDYETARKAVARLGITSKEEYKIRYKEDCQLPRNPVIFYRDYGWVSWEIFLDLRGYSLEKKILLNKAWRVVQALGIVNKKQYLKASKNYPDELHVDLIPEIEARGWFDEKEISYRFLSFKKARDLVHTLGFKTQKEYQKEYRCHGHLLPLNPAKLYKDCGWISWEDYLGSEKYSFEEAKCIVQLLRIKTIEDYRSKCKTRRYPHLPSRPNIHYKNYGWISWRDFLGKS